MTARIQTETPVLVTGWVDGEFRYKGKTASEWVPEVTAMLIERFHPIKIILFGSQGRGESGPDSDIDLLVVLPEVKDRRTLAIQMRVALADIPVPMDLFPTDPHEIEVRGHVVGTVIRDALLEGRVLYDRS